MQMPHFFYRFFNEANGLSSGHIYNKLPFQKTIIADTPVKTVELSAGELKAVFDNALKTHGYGSSNPRFLQCSNNIRIEGKNNPDAGIFEVKQIFIMMSRSLMPVQTR